MANDIVWGSPPKQGAKAESRGIEAKSAPTDPALPGRGGVEGRDDINREQVLLEIYDRTIGVHIDLLRGAHTQALDVAAQAFDAAYWSIMAPAQQQYASESNKILQQRDRVWKDFYQGVLHPAEAEMKRVLGAALQTCPQVCQDILVDAQAKIESTWKQVRRFLGVGHAQGRNPPTETNCRDPRSPFAGGQEIHEALESAMGATDCDSCQQALGLAQADLKSYQDGLRGVSGRIGRIIGARVMEHHFVDEARSRAFEAGSKAWRHAMDKSLQAAEKALKQAQEEACLAWWQSGSRNPEQGVSA